MNKHVYDIALETLKLSAPGLSDTTRRAIARSIGLKAAPATPPGVPDSVRALSEAAEKADNYLWAIGKGKDPSHIAELMRTDYRKSWLSANRYSADYTEADAWEAKHRLLQALLSAHPAGQSTGQGANEPCAWAGGNDTCYCRTCGEEYCYGREDKPACPKKPAPDSPLTGPVGVDLVDGLAAEIADILLDGGALSPKDFARRLAKGPTLAARPAAPEAHGVELPRMLVLSTAHITRKTSGDLNLSSQRGSPYPHLPLFYEKHGNGYFIPITDHWPEDTPPELLKIRTLADSVGATWIMLDRDADTVDSLETWEW